MNKISKITIYLIFTSFCISLFAIPAPFMNPWSNDRYSPSAQALGMGGSFANIWADDMQGMWENPAATAMFVHKNKIGISTSNLEWLNPMGSGAIVGGLKLGEKFTLGLGMSTVNWTYAPDEFSPEIFYGGLHAAVSWHSFINASIGVTEKAQYLKYPDTMMVSDRGLDMGAIVEWPILASFNAGKLNIFDHAMQFDITPGIHYTIKDLGDDLTNNYLFGFNVNVSLKDMSIGSELIHIKYAHDIKDSESMNALQFGLYDMVFIRYGNHSYGSTLFSSSGYGINYSRLIMYLVHSMGIDIDRTSIVNHIDLEQHWGSWSWDGSDMGVSGNTFMLKWRSK